MPTPGNTRYFEDYIVGSEQELGNLSFSEAEIIEFASKYDPQDFHIDPEKAKTSAYGGLIASGWHTAACIMRLLVDEYLDSASSLGSPGLDELRWLAPVRPGDSLTVKVRISDTRRSKSRPERGLVHTWIRAFNQHGTLVASMKAITLIACRERVES
jgi:acyl dehydratase